MQIGLTTTSKLAAALVAAASLLCVPLEVRGQQGAAKPADELYHDYCSVCHGERGDGRSQAILGMQPPPRDFTSPASAAGLTRQRMIEAVRDGVPGTAMVGWTTQLNQTQIESIVDYIRERLMAMPSVAASADEGERVYAYSCSVCHGEDGKGAMWGVRSMDPPPIAFSNYDPDVGLPRARMIASVTHGRPGTSMMAFEDQLSAGQIEQVVDYIRRAFMADGGPSTGERAAPEGAPVPATTVGLAVLRGADQVPRTTLPDPDPATVDLAAPMPFGLVGDPARGSSNFALSCTACHGAAGDGNGPRAYFIFPRPVSFVSADNRARLNRPGLFNSIKHGVRGREMPAWGKVLDDQEIADIAEFVFSAFVAPAAGEEADL